MISLADTTAIVSGGASGIGAAIARGLAGLGAHVVIGDVRVDEGRAVARELGGTFVVCDVSIPEQVTELVDTAVTCGPLRRVVASAGIGHTERTLAGTPGEQRIHDPDAFERVLRINLFGSFDLVRRAAAAMAGQDPDPADERGAVLLVSSVEAFDGQAGQVAYSAAKAALAGMTLPLARDLADYGIRVNTIAPGFIDTPIYGDPGTSAAYKALLAEDVLFPRRLGSVEEVAELSLACLGNPYLNAETIRIDGGIRMRPFLPAR
ncbi:SDR family NAD(P)-dependent oxidoreductase [Rhodococcus phenolicus]|uniref:SDR family NAD(P)-dependent oxidoreductase n=1 Tax=Rhodococcus phenolicus TaxID=263849 RepID=UPI000AA88942|nr:SDR family NAD(P)-dependent oxidoreductase [Rhodococcus phenolicus]